ncbi:MAG: GNAT family N-acetyltransferase [Saprospiraceae bacterium]|nr:GNAT family N-acetyltransferase [Lewinellaceae bacterium]
MQIAELSSQPHRLDDAVNYFWGCWGNTSNFDFYRDCIAHSLQPENLLPKFYLALENNSIIGSYALLVNDLVSRQDLMPWLACLHVNESHRNRGIATALLEHGLQEAGRKNFNHLYLSTDLVGFYEKRGWRVFGTVYNLFGEAFQVYAHATPANTEISL